MEKIRILQTDLKRGLMTKEFMLAIAGMLAAGILGMADIYEELRLQGHLGGGMIFFHMAQTGSSSSLYLYFIPLMAVLPFSPSLRDDMKSGFYLYMMPRCGRNLYFASKLAGAFLAGAITVLASTLILYAGCSFAFPPSAAEIQDFTMYTEEYLRIGLQYLVLGMLYSGVWSVTGMAAAVLMEDKFVGLGVPFILSYILSAFQRRYYQGLPYLNPQEWAAPFVTDAAVDFCLLAAVTALTGIGSFRILKRRLL